MKYGLENSLLPIICDRLERWDTHGRACVNIRWRFCFALYLDSDASPISFAPRFCYSRHRQA